MDTAAVFLKHNAADGLITWDVQKEAAARFGMTPRKIEGIALSLDLLPVRYLKNRTTINAGQQRALFNGTVAVVGCGGLGGYIIEELARIGVGTIRVIDHDIFEEHNLNRQALCTLSSLGKAKVDAAVQRVKEINPACEAVALNAKLTAANAPPLLNGATVVADGLDNIPSRLDLADACVELGIPLIHGTIGGWYGMVLTQGPAHNRVRQMYGGSRGLKGIEETLGNPSFTSAFIASIEAAEVCKILTGEGTILDGRMLFINLLDMAIETFTI